MSTTEISGAVLSVPSASTSPASQDLRISRKELQRLHALASGRDGETLLGIAAANALLLHEIAHHLSTISPRPGTTSTSSQGG